MPIPKPGGLITKVTMALDSSEGDYAPVNPTTEFEPDDTIHAIVTVKKAPPGTKFTVNWLTTDVGNMEEANFLIDTTETIQAGSGNMDFTLSPTTCFAEGTYGWKFM